MNKFSIYQYLLILVVLIVGSLYALPNLYPTQPSIQVAYTDSGRSADQSLLNDLENILEESKTCLLYTSPSPRDGTSSRMPSSA